MNYAKVFLGPFIILAIGLGCIRPTTGVQRQPTYLRIVASTSSTGKQLEVHYTYQNGLICSVVSIRKNQTGRISPSRNVIKVMSKGGDMDGQIIITENGKSTDVTHSGKWFDACN